MTDHITLFSATQIAAMKEDAERWRFVDDCLDLTPYLREYHSGMCLSNEAIDAARKVINFEAKPKPMQLETDLVADIRAAIYKYAGTGISFAQVIGCMQIALEEVKAEQ